MVGHVWDKRSAAIAGETSAKTSFGRADRAVVKCQENDWHRLKEFRKVRSIQPPTHRFPDVDIMTSCCDNVNIHVWVFTDLLSFQLAGQQRTGIANNNRRDQHQRHIIDMFGHIDHYK